jgi:hypothetical protein
MRSQQNGGFCQEADEEQPGRTGRDYYRFQIKEKKDMKKSISSCWLDACRNTGVEPPQASQDFGCLMARNTIRWNTNWPNEAAESKSSSKSLAIRRSIEELLDDRFDQISSVDVSQVGPSEMMTDGVEPKESTVYRLRTCCTWKTCTKKAGLLRFLPSLPVARINLAPLCPVIAVTTSQIQTSLEGQGTRRDYLFEVGFCSALAPLTRRVARNSSTLDRRRSSQPSLVYFLTHPS